MSEPMWCEVRQHYCRCGDYGKRCDDFDKEPESKTYPPICPATGLGCLEACDGRPPYCAKPYGSSE
jgi:hypothetical protein